jgi:threonine dehydrogenase-like Zn-dependent dehydrogenase
MRAAIFNGPGSIEIGERPDPRIEQPTDAVVRVVMACVCGSDLWYDTAAAIARPGSTIGIVGVPHGTVPFNATFFRNIAWRGGPAPTRIYIPELLDDVLENRINPGLVLDFETDLDGTPTAYEAMNDRTAIKSLIRVGSL